MKDKANKWVIATYHPELQPGEILFGNAWGDMQVQQMVEYFLSTRVGDVAYTREPKEDQELIQDPSAKPIFVLKHEVIKAGYTVLVFDGGYIPVDEESEILMGGSYNVRVEAENIKAITNGSLHKPEISPVDWRVLVGIHAIVAITFYIVIWILLFIINWVDAGEIVWIWPLNYWL